MWNLSSLAQKAKEAAARLESQLDDSIGIADDSLFGGTKSSTADGGAGSTSGGATTTTTSLTTAQEELHDDLNEEDDFFSESHHERLMTKPDVQQKIEQTSSQSGQGYDVNTQLQQQYRQEEVAAPAGATKMDVSVDEENDFFGDNTTPTAMVATQQHDQYDYGGQTNLSSDNISEEEVDFGADDSGGDGWEEGDDIPLDDDNEEELFSDKQNEQQEGHQQQTESAPQEVDMITPMDSDSPIEEPTEEIAVEEAVEQLSEIEPLSSEVVDEEVVVEQSMSEEGGSFGMPPPVNEHVEERSNALESEAFVEEHQPEEVEATIFAPVDDVDMIGETAPIDIDPSLPATEGDSTQYDYTLPTEDSQTETMLQHDDIMTPAVDYSSDSQPQTSTTATSSPSIDDTEKMQFLETISQLESQLLLREQQLASKSDQITSLTMQNEEETTKLRQIITETKEEAKKRILRAKERVDEMQSKLSEAVRRADSAGGNNHEQSEIIAALRAEGDQLARKQSQMEQSVRSAKGEARDLKEQLDIQTESRVKALEKIASLEKDVKSLKDELSSARKGESQSKKLEGDLVAAKEESEKQRASNLGLEQQLKELKEENKSLRKEVDDAKQGAALESERESSKLRKERDDMLGDLESKLRTSEREANVREDALRHEVSELRKRWQDAVRRAEGKGY
eukprot:scaffold1772_cov185-Alexandrium_tamarense.AAC.9